jgi:hypothetical protein
MTNKMEKVIELNNTTYRPKTFRIFSFRTISGENCTLNFGCNTKFNYSKKDNNMVELSRSNINFEITLKDFEKYFKLQED